MSPFRIVVRWALTLLALGLLLVALLISGVRLAASQMDMLRDNLSEQFALHFNALMQLETLDADLQWLDPSLGFSDLTLVSQAGGEPSPLLEIEQARLRLDTLASLRAGYPKFDDARIANVTVHLYQDRQGHWRWPPPVDIPDQLIPDEEFDLAGFDAAIDALLRQHVAFDDVRLVLHGIHGSATLVAPRILLAGDAQRAHLEGVLFIEGQQQHSLEAAMEIFPGRPSGGKQSGGKQSAALHARMDLQSLSELGRLLTGREAVQLTELSGDAQLWGRWKNNRLEDARALLDIPSLTLMSEEGPTQLHNLGARAQWLRGEGNSWQAWVSALSVSDEQERDSPLPSHLHLQGDNQQWSLRSAPFDIALLADWGERLPLSEPTQRLLQQLAPVGRVEGLEVGYLQQQWQTRAALRDVEVAPWGEIPGGGPFDAWVETRGGQGSVQFSGGQGMTLAFPEVFDAPLVLDRGDGVINWSWDEQGWSVAGDGLALGWRGAEVNGSFRYASPDRAPSELDIDMAMYNVDALDTPLLEWLPVKIFDAEFLEWLGGGIAGYVPQGALRLHHVFDGRERNEDNELHLSLDIEEGRLPYDPQWPALEQVSGRLTIDGESLAATIAHAETQGLVSDEARVTLKDDWLHVEGPVQGSPQALLDFLAASPIEGLETFDEWQSEGNIAGRLIVGASMAENDDSVEVDVEANVDAPQLVISQAGLNLANVNGDLHYRFEQDRSTLTGVLGARAFDGPLLARFDVGGEGISLEGRALARGMLEWAELSSLDGLLSGYFPYTAQLTLQPGQPRLVVESDLESLVIELPPPFGKRAGEVVPLHIESSLDEQRVHAELADRFRLRWRLLGEDAEQAQGQLWLENWPASAAWPTANGWDVVWRSRRLDMLRWQDALADLGILSGGDTGAGQSVAALPPLRHVQLETDCLYVESRCWGAFEVGATPLDGGWRFDLAGPVLEGQAHYRPGQPRPLDINLSSMHLDSLFPDRPQATNLAEEIATAPLPEPLPDGLEAVPDGRLAIDTLHYRGQQFGPLSTQWDTTSQRLRLTPLSLGLGEITAGGELVWEASGGESSLTRSRISLTGGDLGSMLEILGQPLALRNERSEVQTQLAWPGTPWQFALERSRGSIDVALQNGRFMTLESPSAKLIGLLNVDNLLRRLRLDFSDVTGKGTAFDSVQGDATLYGGRLETHGPIEIQGPSTQFSLDGNVDLANRQLDARLGITLPVSQNLPLAAVLAGAPYVGGALFLADKLFGGWVDKVTRIHYRVRGSWAAPQITLENAE